MGELVGFCAQCGKPIHCLHGFLNGVISEGKETLYCFPCHEKQKEKEGVQPDKCHR
ncbi:MULTISPECIES: hypothetical protein [Geobacillus]|uniref:Uncharacterized protein n=1 Tax=Geobacillus thermodenitrificans TaxID=33940 RepID=A0ABY9QDJ2_GEOTD|nr:MULTISPECIES: hypothetical protein [Geobacillus]MEC5188946.1 hypothetical protein [Geobacillus thermodenitrificans]MED3716588.1 hypothetical protein [Geobacillus thermodenitrificans]MED3905537.1 hypothetical protein [Geobacillus thermodenitrificans]MED4916608.1 hypothetical protein [Geobacillus thermodenitrificans]QNU30477.1 hypothetical protein IC804_13690 [Geobacillus sp. 47C-IIb]